MCFGEGGLRMYGRHGMTKLESYTLDGHADPPFFYALTGRECLDDDEMFIVDEVEEFAM